jgi:hypothetical protein
VRWTDGIERTSLGPEVAGVVTIFSLVTFSLVPAGTHRGRAIVDELLDDNRDGDRIEDVVWDPGYSLCKPGTVHHRLAQAGIHQTFQPVTHQRGIKPFSGEALLIDGQLFSSLLPEELRDLPAPPRGASEKEKLAYDANQGQVQPAGPMAAHPACWAGCRWSHSLAVPLLLRAHAEPVVPEDDAGVPDGAVGGDGGGMLLLGDPDGDASGAALVAVHHVRHDSMADQHGPAAGRRVGELCPQGGLC